MAILLVGTDFSTRSDRAMRRAILLARQENHDLLLTHIVERQGGDAVDEDRAHAAELLRRIASEIGRSEELRCRTELRSGSAAEQLSAVAREARAELMLIGPHRRRLLRDRFSNSTANRIVRQATVPLLIANAIPTGAYRRALLPTDFGDSSRRTAGLARALPFLRGVGLSLVHVFDAEAREMLGRSLVRGTERQDYVGKEADGARAELAAFAEDVGLQDARRLVRETSGSVAADIDRLAADEGADLIILSRSNKGLVAEAILGSVTESVIRKAKRDVLIVPEAIGAE